MVIRIIYEKQAVEVDTTEFCHYGCGSVAKFLNVSGRYMCMKYCASCPAMKAKNSQSIKNSEAHKSRDYSTWYSSTSEEAKKKMAWAKGFTKETHEGVRKSAIAPRRRITDDVRCPICERTI